MHATMRSASMTKHPNLGAHLIPHWCFVHKPVQRGRNGWDELPKAELSEKWGKRNMCFDWENPREKEEVAWDAVQSKVPVHFATIMEWCFIKNAQLAPELQKYRRIVLRGDNIKDQDNKWATFSEIQCSSSLMITTKMVDAVSRGIGYVGEDADAVGGCTQMEMSQRRQSC